MYILKLDAIDSTNDYLRRLSAVDYPDKWIVATTEYQSRGRGQQEATWHSESGKNLTFSVLIKTDNLKAGSQFGLNCMVSLAIHKALQRFGVPDLRIKWPNDIMSGSGKLGGILIENTLSGNRITRTIIGIGLNVNQESFPEELPGAISVRQLLHAALDREELFKTVLGELRQGFESWELGGFKSLKRQYEPLLYQLNVTRRFADRNGKPFEGKIRGVTAEGLLQVEKADGRLAQFRFKEITYL